MDNDIKTEFVEIKKEILDLLNICIGMHGVLISLLAGKVEKQEIEQITEKMKKLNSAIGESAGRYA